MQYITWRNTPSVLPLDGSEVVWVSKQGGHILGVYKNGRWIPSAYTSYEGVKHEPGKAIDYTPVQWCYYADYILAAISQ